ncbi:hypothetical protein GGS21DRAFT_487489 [Xylaria nigripes]|nr:hypothetical protein GGS21DRAFT_487489 [Xylaria nigripes]
MSAPAENTEMNSTPDNYVSKVPVLTYTTGKENQAFFHRMPANPSMQGGSAPPRGMFLSSIKTPPGFGELSMACDTPRSADLRDGTYNYVFARSNVTAETLAHGTDRKDGDAYDREMFHPLRHPTFDGPYNYEGRDQLSALEKRLLEIHVHYPNIRNGIMNAPFLFQPQHFTLPEAQQYGAFRQIFGTVEIFELVMASLLHRYEDLTNLCRTSQFVARQIQGMWMHLDARGNDFLGLDMIAVRGVQNTGEEPSPNVASRAAKLRQGVEERGFSQTVLISPIRSEGQGSLRQPIFDEAGYPITSSIEPFKESSFPRSLHAHYKLLHMTFLNGEFIKHLVLHGLPWLNVSALECILPEMRELETLGVHQCFLMTLGETLPLLRAINNINSTRPQFGDPFIRADFTPFYYRGPHYEKDGTGHVGEYGVVANGTIDLDTARGITALLMPVWALCKEGDQDFFTPGTGFRSFLDRLPLRLHTLPNILRSIAAIHDFNTGKYHSGENLDNLYRGAPCTEDGKKPVIDFLTKNAMERTLWQDLIVSCNGRPIEQSEFQAIFVYNDRVKKDHCRHCGEQMSTYFFWPEATERWGESMCHGCYLTLIIATQTWRLYHKRKHMAERIFINDVGIKYCLCKVLNKTCKPAGEAIPHGIGRPAEFARGAIPFMSGSVDIIYLGWAEQLWEDYNYRYRRERIFAKRQIRQLDQAELSQSTPCSDLFREIKRKFFGHHVEQVEQFLGVSQSTLDYGSNKRICRSWEDNIEDYRTDLALQNGRVIDPESMVPVDSLPRYWRQEVIDEDEN